MFSRTITLSLWNPSISLLSTCYMDAVQPNADCYPLSLYTDPDLLDWEALTEPSRNSLQTAICTTYKGNKLNTFS